MGSILGLGTKIPCAGRQLSLHMPQLLSPLGLQLRPDAAKKKKKTYGVRNSLKQRKRSIDPDNPRVCRATPSCPLKTHDDFVTHFKVFHKKTCNSPQPLHLYGLVYCYLKIALLLKEVAWWNHSLKYLTGWQQLTKTIQLLSRIFIFLSRLDMWSSASHFPSLSLGFFLLSKKIQD